MPVRSAPSWNSPRTLIASHCAESMGLTATSIPTRLSSPARKAASSRKPGRLRVTNSAFMDDALKPAAASSARARAFSSAAVP